MLVSDLRSPEDPGWEVFRFSREPKELALPMWLAWGYLATNTMLTLLNFYWFKQMIAAVSKRFSKKRDIIRVEKAE